MRKIEPLALKFSVGILMILFSITGCSDMPYTGSVLTVHEVDRYLVSTDGNVVCFQDELDATCLKLTPETGNGAINGPAIHIYPERRVYVFYHEGKPILRAVRADNNGNNNDDNNDNNGNGNNNGNNGNNNGNGDNNDNNGNNNDGNNGNGDNNGNNGGDGNDNNDNNGNNNDGNDNNDNNGGDNNNNGDDSDDNNDNDNNNPPNNNNPNNDPTDPTDNTDDSNDGHGWIIWVYYPEGTAAQNPPTLSESGVTVTINGQQITDDDITGFAQFIGPNNEVGVQFFYPTQSAELLDLKIRIEGIAAAEDPVKFNINYLWNSQ